MSPFAVGTFCALFVPGLKKRAFLVKVVLGTPEACTRTLTVGVGMLRVPLLAFVALVDRQISIPGVTFAMRWDASFVCVSQQKSISQDPFLSALVLEANSHLPGSGTGLTVEKPFNFGQFQIVSVF